MTDGTDAFNDALADLKRHADELRPQPSEEASARMWARIDDATRDVQPAADRGPIPGTLRRVPTPVWMGMAAAVVLAAVVTLLVLQTPGVQLIASSADERVEHVLPDGSIVTLRPHSALYLVRSDDESVRYRMTGEAYFAVASRPHRVFSVEAGEALVEVLGTRFNLSTWGESASVYLEEGRIRFAHQTSGSDVILAPGQSSRIAPESGVVSPSADASDEYLDWLGGEMVFSRQPVRLVAGEMEHHFDIRLDVPAPVAAETVSGRILLDTKEQSLDDLARVMGGRFVATGPDSYRFESDRIQPE